MFEAYKIGVTLVANNLVSPQPALLAKEFENLDVLVIDLQKSLKKISADSSGLRALTTATNATNRAFERANLSAAAFRNHLASIHQSSGAIGVASAMAASRGRLPPAGGGGGGGSRGPSGMHGGNVHVGPGGVGLGTMGFAAGAGYWPLLAAGAAAYGGKALYESAKDLNTEQYRFRLLGMTEAQNQEAFTFAKNRQIYGTTQIERLAAFREAQGVGRESNLPDSAALNFAKIASPFLAKLDALGKGLDDEAKGALHSSNVALLRFDEQAGGLKSAAEFGRLADIAYKLRQSSGGTIDFEQLRAVTSRGGAYTQNKTDEGWAYAEPIIQELKGNAYGVGVQTAGMRLFNVLSRTPKNLAAEATRLGLWTPQRQHLSDEDSKLFKENFEKFYIDRLMPLYAKFNLSANDRIRDNSILLGRTGGTVANLIEKQIPSIQRSWGSFQKALPIDDAVKQLQKSLSGQEQEFVAAWTDFKTNFGTKMLPFFTGVLKAGSTILRALPDPDGNKVVSGLTGAIFGSPGAIVNRVIDFLPNDSRPQRSFVGKGGSQIVFKSTIKLKERVIGEAVTAYQGEEAGRPQTGINTFDGLMGLVPPGS